jgi:hypothetical protein
LGVGEGDLGTVPLLLSQENRSGSGVRERQVHSACRNAGTGY